MATVSRGKCRRSTTCCMTIWPTAQRAITSSAPVFLQLPCVRAPRERSRGHAPLSAETEFVAGVAAMSDSGAYGKIKVAAGIVGYADLTSGDWVTPVLEAQICAGGGSGSWAACGIRPATTRRSRHWQQRC